MKATILISFAVFFLLACDANRIFEQHQHIPDIVWRRDYKLTFEKEINDLSSSYNIAIAIRHIEGYGGNVLRVNLSHTDPVGREKNKDYELILKDEDGYWVGEGMGQMWDTEVMVMENFQFKEAGKHIFVIRHNMPHELVPLVMEIGLIIDKVPEAG